MKRIHQLAHVIWLISISTGVIGCQRGVCDESVVGQTPRIQELPAFWKQHPELLPERVVPCTGESKASSETLEVDFEPEPKVPVGTINERLESAGWTRMTQRETGMGHELQYEKAQGRLTVTTITGHKRTHAIFYHERVPEAE